MDRQMDLESFFEQRRTWLEETIAAYVDHESPTAEPDRVTSLGLRIEEDCKNLGARLETLDLHPRPVCARFGGNAPDLCLVFHHDTVWPVGSFKRHGHDGNRWYGPGIFDMKANIPLVLLTLEYLSEVRPDLLERIMLVSSPDEEIMGPGSVKGVTNLGKNCEWALVFEPPKPSLAYKQRRKGIGKAKLRFHGLATHAGNHYHEGKSALAAASRFLLAAEGWTNVEQGLTVNIGLLSGGSAANTRPAQADMTVDVRVVDEDQWCQFKRFMMDWRDETGVEMEVREHRLIPPMNSQHQGWTVLQSTCEALGLPYSTDMAGGGSDGSNLSAQGVKVLDGLGIPGAGEHAENEHILTDQLFNSFQRNTHLIQALLT